MPLKLDSPASSPPLPLNELFTPDEDELLLK